MERQDIPEIVLKLAERNDEFQKYLANLSSTVTWYNKIKRNARPVEFDLIKNNIADIDNLVVIGQNELNWNSEGKYFHKI